MALRIAIFAFTCTLAVAATKLQPFSDEFIDLINSKQTTWKAGRNFDPNTPMTHIKRLAGVHPNFNVDSLPIVEHDAELIANLPDSFDPRDKWPNCSSFAEIRDQGSCGSDWAIAAVSAMTDRICIYSNGATYFHISAEDLLSCCFLCGSCQGGDPTKAWEYWQKRGLVSGGNYNSREGCRPYSIPTCDHHEPGYPQDSTHIGTTCMEYDYIETPKCYKTCRDGYGVAYKKDRQYGQRKPIHTIAPREEHIMAELLKNGPVEAVFAVYSDFYHYKSGVYQYVAGEYVNAHAVKLLGWGVDNGTKYWLAANSWNKYWGDNGFFKIHRGEDHLGIESYVVAGVPQLNN